MFKKTTFFATLVGLGFLLGAISGAIASDKMSEKMPDDHNMQMETSKPPEFKSIDQPLGNKIIVTVTGASLIGAELWWFLWSKSKSKKAKKAESKD